MDNIMWGEKPQKQQIAIMEVDEDGISAPNWLFEVLAWISRIEMANSQLSFSCKLFKQLCFPKLHGNVKPYKIKMLEFCGGGWWKSGYLLLNGHDQPFPIPNVPPPSYILGFKHIFMHFLDDQLLKFVQNILPWFNQIQFSMAYEFKGWKPDDKRTKTFRRLLDSLAHKISKFIFHYEPARVCQFNRLFPGFLQKVDYLYAYPFPAEFDTLFEWLVSPSINGEKQQKILKLERSFTFVTDTDKFIDRIKKEFSNASKPLNYFIKCPLYYRVAHFNKENEKTGERLTSFRIVGMQNSHYYIVRCPKGEEIYWKIEGEKKMRETWNDENQTFIEAQIDKFGV